MVLDRARQQVGALVGRDPRQVFFTSGATESNAWALRGLGPGLVLTSAVEHPSVLAWADRIAPVDRRGVVDVAALRAQAASLAGELAVISVMAANNETGVLQPIAEIAALARSLGVPFHCDATQLPGRLRMEIDADLITLSAHKFGGPRGVGALVTALELDPLLRGGPQERQRRAGTHNIPAIAGMGAAAAVLGAMDPGPRDALEATCRALGARILGEGAPRLPNTLSVLFGVPGDLVVMALDLEGVCASNGSACSSGAAADSHVLAAMGLSGIPVRFSVGADAEVGEVCRIIERVIKTMEASCVSSQR